MNILPLFASDTIAIDVALQFFFSPLAHLDGCELL
jgi:hypothetical protein